MTVGSAGRCARGERNHLLHDSLIKNRLQKMRSKMDNQTHIHALVKLPTATATYRDLLCHHESYSTSRHHPIQYGLPLIIEHGGYDIARTNTLYFA